MAHQNAQYLKLKWATYYFTRRVPKRLQRHCFGDRIEVCLHTSSKHHAARQSIVLSSQLEDQWNLMRKRDMHRSLWRYFDAQSISLSEVTERSPNTTAATIAPHLSVAVETYVSMKGAGRPKTFAAGVHRSLRYLVEIAGNKPIDAYVRTDANALRDYLRGRGLSSETIKRILSNLRAIMNFVSKELGLEPSLAFSAVYLGEDVGTVKRKPVAVKDIETKETTITSAPFSPSFESHRLRKSPGGLIRPSWDPLALTRVVLPSHRRTQPPHWPPHRPPKAP